MGKKRFNKIFLTIFGVFLIALFCFSLSSCSPIEPEDVITSIMPNLWVFLSHLFATIVLLTLCIWLVWKPSKETLHKRNEYIQNQINQAEEARQEALKKLAEAEKEKINAHGQAQNILEIASNQAYQLKEKIETEAKNNAKKITDDAVNEGIKIKTDIYSSMDREILDIAFDATSSLLKKKVSRKDSDQFVKDFIAQVKKDKGE